MLRIAATWAAAAALSGCDLTAPATLPAQPVAEELRSLTGVPLRRLPNVDVANMSNVVATYQGSDRRQILLVVVFDSTRAPVQLMGAKSGRSPDDTEVIVERNVAVVYTSRQGGSRSKDIRQGLAALEEP